MDRIFEVELYEEDGTQKIFISTDGASGAKYVINSLDEIGELVIDYVKDYEHEE